VALTEDEVLDRYLSENPTHQELPFPYQLPGECIRA
jgi:hypothetical protein